MAAVTKLIRPSNVRGSPTEDARQWLECYEKISTHNGWGDANKRNNFTVYLDDTTQNWFLCAEPTAGGN